MPAKAKACSAQPILPAIARPDRRRFVEQTVLIFLLGQSGKLGMQRVIGGQERLLAVQDRRVGAGRVFEAVNLAGAQREPDAAPQDLT
jgi:hypothetical protein